MNDVILSLDYKNLSFIVTVTDWHLDKEYDEFITISGYVELDGDVNGIVDITSSDMDVIIEMTYDNESLFGKILDENSDKIYDIVLKKEESLMARW